MATELAPVQPTAAVQEAAVHEVRGETLEFEPASIALSTEKPTLLAFLSSGCLTCSEFFSSFSDRPAMNEALRDIELVIVPKSRNEENVKKLREMAPADFPTVMSSETWARLQVPGSPYFVLIDSDHQFLGAGSANTWSQVHSLVADSLDERRIIEGKASRAGSRFSREDADLAAAGITPDHPSLYRGIWGEGDDR